MGIPRARPFTFQDIHSFGPWPRKESSPECPHPQVTRGCFSIHHDQKRSIDLLEHRSALNALCYREKLTALKINSWRAVPHQQVPDPLRLNTGPLPPFPHTHTEAAVPFESEAYKPQWFPVPLAHFSLEGPTLLCYQGFPLS